MNNWEQPNRTELDIADLVAWFERPENAAVRTVFCEAEVNDMWLILTPDEDEQIGDAMTAIDPYTSGAYDVAWMHATRKKLLETYKAVQS